MQNPTRGPTCTPSVTRVIHIPRIAPQPRIPCILLHTTATVIMISAYHTLTKLPRHAVISAQYGGQFQYLTVQGLFMTCTTSFITLVIELFFSNDSDLGNHASASWELLLKKSINHIKYILITIAMPLSLTISLIYWPLLVFATQFILQCRRTCKLSWCERN
ncbi:hypothetical protein F5879DRAFT_347660 [Lentinula edodes]|nr:hypothetical protein F5879DRAFT_347660 [Lentinula edodes]